MSSPNSTFSTHFHSSSSFSFPPTTTFSKIQLTKDNYLYWKTFIIPYIRATTYLNYVEGHISPPPKTLFTTLENSSESSSNTIYIQWLATSQLILSTLIYTHHEFIIPTIVGINLFFSLWNSLQQRFPQSKHVIQLHL